MTVDVTEIEDGSNELVARQRFLLLVLVLSGESAEVDVERMWRSKSSLDGFSVRELLLLLLEKEKKDKDKATLNLMSHCFLFFSYFSFPSASLVITWAFDYRRPPSLSLFMQVKDGALELNEIYMHRQIFYRRGQLRQLRIVG